MKTRIQNIESRIQKGKNAQTSADAVGVARGHKLITNCDEIGSSSTMSSDCTELVTNCDLFGVSRGGFERLEVSKGWHERRRMWEKAGKSRRFFPDSDKFSRLFAAFPGFSHLFPLEFY